MKLINTGAGLHITTISSYSFWPCSYGKKKFPVLNLLIKVMDLDPICHV